MLSSFNGFVHMDQYFQSIDNIMSNIETQKKIIEEKQIEFDEKVKNHECYVQEKLKTIERNNVMLNSKLKNKERELIQKIENKNIEIELSNTGKIMCDNHFHKT